MKRKDSMLRQAQGPFPITLHQVYLSLSDSRLDFYSPHLPSPSDCWPFSSSPFLPLRSLSLPPITPPDLLAFPLFPPLPPAPSRRDGGRGRGSALAQGNPRTQFDPGSPERATRPLPRPQTPFHNPACHLSSSSSSFFTRKKKESARPLGPRRFLPYWFLPFFPVGQGRRRDRTATSLRDTPPKTRPRPRARPRPPLPFRSRRRRPS